MEAKDLKKLQQQHRKLGYEIEKLKKQTTEKWHKVFSPSWIDSNGEALKYSISYICDSSLRKLDEYFILKTYQDKNSMISEF
jgi:2-methylcitrate dehydratase PrpD